MWRGPGPPTSGPSTPATPSRRRRRWSAWGCCLAEQGDVGGPGPPTSGPSTPATPTRRRRRCATWSSSSSRARIEPSLSCCFPARQSGVPGRLDKPRFRMLQPGRERGVIVADRTVELLLGQACGGGEVCPDEVGPGQARSQPRLASLRFAARRLASLEVRLDEVGLGQSAPLRFPRLTPSRGGSRPSTVTAACTSTGGLSSATYWAAFRRCASPGSASSAAVSGCEALYW